MSNAFEEIKAGLEDAIAWQRGDENRGIAHFIKALPVNVKDIRTRLGITQETFCESYGISLSTLKKWETGIREPEGPTKAYLYLISQRPDIVKKTLRSVYDKHLEPYKKGKATAKISTAKTSRVKIKRRQSS